MPSSSSSSKRPAADLNKGGSKMKTVKKQTEKAADKANKQYDKARRELKAARNEVKQSFSAINKAVRNVAKYRKQIPRIEGKIFKMFLAMLKKNLKARTTLKKDENRRVWTCEEHQEFEMKGVDVELVERLLKENEEDDGDINEEEEQDDAAEDDEDEGTESKEEEEASHSASGSAAADNEAQLQQQKLDATKHELQWCVEHRVDKWNTAAQSAKQVWHLDQEQATQIFCKSNLESTNPFVNNGTTVTIKTVKLTHEKDTLSVSITTHTH
ncbi:unnamed protein product [Amoebophrya sp. A25]|nr:unnamed protein product [Amoebophrya sp. A25]|eukprot:GSA25T00025412001.1